jgi:16S rRNA (uracil1498-N3)-methyltransferase
MQLFYHNGLTEKSVDCTFDTVESQHITRVLRKKEGAILWITNGKGLLFESEIVQAYDKKCKVKIRSVISKKSNRNYYLQIAIAPTKNMDRMEWFVEKATEIGVDEISFIFCEHSERKVVKTERLEKVMIAAMKQSAQYVLPKLTEPMTFSKFLKSDFEGQRFIAHCEETERKLFKHVIEPTGKIQILIGPEGDFSTKEIESALKKGFKPVTFGENRLRTETAGIVAVNSVALINEQ